MCREVQEDNERSLGACQEESRNENCAPWLITGEKSITLIFRLLMLPCNAVAGQDGGARPPAKAGRRVSPEGKGNSGRD
jgi:hypothetical protein